ncbi:MAG TPA: hypothetical protein VGD62_03950 [Acidobacteriaceae bacterium]
MKYKTPMQTFCAVSLFFLAASTCALAQEHRQAHLTGLINDYTPSDVKGGPYEMHGQWVLEIHEDGNTADFTVDMTMSDYGMTSTGAPDATQGGQGAHTHHIVLNDRPITWNMAGCPAYSPATTHGFQIGGTVNLLSGNGSKAPFEPAPPESTLQVCVTGGTEVDYSNLSLVLAGPATAHFGPQAIHGVVRKGVERDR